MTDPILFEKRGGLGIVTLNRPKALNALTLDMFRAADAQFSEWERDPSLKHVVLRGNGERAFCAGGDVRAVAASRHHPPGPGDYKTELFREEFRFIRRLHRYPKPVLALTHGITMGGGMGLSVNSAHCVESESDIFAMPEVFIGSFPDIGATRFLSRCPGKIGVYLALTGARADAGDGMYVGFARSFIPQARFDAVLDALSASANPEEVLGRFRQKAPPSRLETLRPAIDRVFGLGSVEEIFSALRREKAQWATEALAAMQRASPLSMKLAFEMQKRGAGLDLEGALQLEYRAMMHLLEESDFYEGVRAVLVDKDHKPRWRFASLEEVGDAEVERHFVPIGAEELTFAREGSPVG